MKYKACALLITGILLSDVCFARFVQTDAELVDQEELISFENYNDKISYQYPNNWIEQWRETANGLRINAGSLTTSVFDYFHELKVSSEDKSPFYISYSQWRHDDFTEAIFLQELKLAAKWECLEFLLLADGSGAKEFGDLGVGLAYKESSSSFVEFQLWSVDHYYNTKKKFSEESRNRPTYSIISKGNYNIFDTKIRFFYEYETPFEWKRTSKQYTYSYERTYQFIELERVIQNRVGYVKYTSDVKSEAKIFTDENFKSMDRYHYDFGLGVRSESMNRVLHDLGLQIINRNAYYVQSTGIGEQGEFFSESLSPSQSIRDENGIFYTINRPAPFGRYQLGAFVNSVALAEDQIERRENEIKIGTAIDWQIRKTSRLFVNTTWDIDQLWSDFSNKTTLRPWGGGNLQFQVVF